MTGDFKEFFDLRRLDEDQLAQIQFVLTSPAYDSSFKPYMQGVLASLNRMWKDRRRERQDEYTDDFLAGGVTFGEGLLAFFDRLIQETNADRMLEAMAAEASPERQYTTRLHQGQMRPVVGLDQPALPEPLAPEEDY